MKPCEKIMQDTFLLERNSRNNTENFTTVSVYFCLDFLLLAHSNEVVLGWNFHKCMKIIMKGTDFRCIHNISILHRNRVEFEAKVALLLELIRNNCVHWES